MKTYFRNLLAPIVLVSVAATSCNPSPVPADAGPARLEMQIQLEPQESGLTGSLRGVCGVDARVAWVSGTGGSFSRTSDGGRTWQPGIVAGAEELDFRDIHAWSEQQAILMAAGPGENSRIYTTSDGGTNWAVTYQNDYQEGFFDGMDFDDSGRGFLYGDAVQGRLFVMQSRDKGQTWERIPSEVLPEMREGEHGFAASGTGIVINGDRILIGSGGSVSRIHYSADRGASWQAIETPIVSGDAASGIFSLAVGDSGLAVAVGGSYQNPQQTGRNLASSQTGISWELVSAQPAFGYKSIIAIVPGSSDQSWIVSGTSGTNYSTDAGQTWRPIDVSGYHALDFGSEPDSGWAAGSEGRVAKVVISTTGR